jgi:hypothetical protein
MSVSASTTGPELVADLVQHRDLGGEEVVQGLLDPDPQVLGVQRGGGRLRAHATRLKDTEVSGTSDDERVRTRR